MDHEIKTSAEVEEGAVLPRRHGVRCNPDGSVTTEGDELPDGVSCTPVDGKSTAEWAYERLIIYIQNFEEQLDDEHEIAMGFTGGDVGVVRIEGLGFFDPDIVTFYGTDQLGTKTQLIQHVTQLNVMLRALPKQSGQPEPTRIGFRLAADLKRAD